MSVHINNEQFGVFSVENIGHYIVFMRDDGALDQEAQKTA